MRKPIRRQCKSLREYLKIERKWLPKLFGPRRNWRKFKNYWYTWIWVDLLDCQLKDPYFLKYVDKLYKKGSKNLKNILSEVTNNYGWEFTRSSTGKTYKLRGIQISNEDYYIYVSNDGEKCFSSCVGYFTDITHWK